MGFIIWYQLAFTPVEGLPPLLRVSNDLLSGDLIADAEIHTTDRLGAQAGTFEITLHDLPKTAADLLADRHRASAGDSPLLVDIRLGYFDQPTTQQQPVLLGAVTELQSQVSSAGELLTVIKGEEIAGHRLLSTGFEYHGTGLSSLQTILQAIHDTSKVEVVAGAEVGGSRRDYTTRASTAMAALRQVATEAGTPLAVYGGRAVLGSKVTSGTRTKLNPQTNLVRQTHRDQRSGDHVVAAEARPGAHQEFTVLGDPGLHIGGQVTEPQGTTLTVTAVQHHFSITSGFLTELDTIAGPLPAQPAPPATGVDGFLDTLERRIQTTVDDRTAVRVGAVTAYRPSGDGEHGGHRATLRYGQQPAPELAAPSVDAEIGQDQLLHDKPMASPFAWDRCGLIVPVYEGMRGLLVHNRGETTDAVTAGFVWSRHDQYTPPENEPGDYWLCLPTEVLDGRPNGKGVNDLTDASGRRMIQAGALAIQVGKELLPDVGKRPDLPDDETLVITHSSGTTITVAADGSLSITTSGPDIKLGNGDASITISGTDITLAAKTVDVVEATP
jgi:hypothetical protein